MKEVCCHCSIAFPRDRKGAALGDTKSRLQLLFSDFSWVVEVLLKSEGVGRAVATGINDCVRG